MRKLLLRVWRVISHVDTSVSILGWAIPSGLVKVIVGTITAAIGVTGAWLLAYGFALAFVLGCVGLVAGVWFVNGLGWRREQGASSGQLQASSGDSHVASVYKTMLSNDDENRARCYLILQKRIDWSHVNPQVGSAWIEFYYTVYTRGVYDLVFKRGVVDGHLRYIVGNSQHPGTIREPFRIDIRNQVRVGRTFESEIRFRNYLPTEVHNDIRAASGNPISFDFNEIRIPVQTVLPDGTEGKLWDITLPTEWTTEVPQSAFLPEQVPDTSDVQP